LARAYNRGDVVLRIDRDYHERLPLLLVLAHGPLSVFLAALDSALVEGDKAWIRREPN
jgi:hypothetical protein